MLNQFFPVISGPEELRLVAPLVDERGGDFCGCVRNDPEMVASSCAASFLPMSEDQTGFEVLLVKAHRERSVLFPGQVSVTRSTVRHSRGLVLRVDHDFPTCLDRTVRAHEGRWLTDSLCAALLSLHEEPLHGVRARSIEIYAPDTGRLVAGEVGYSCGAAYTSMSGYFDVSGTGSVQLAALGQLLAEAGFAFWDLGMELDYKFTIGAVLVDRDEFTTRYLDAAATPAPDLPSQADCEALVTRARAVTVARRRRESSS